MQHNVIHFFSSSTLLLLRCFRFHFAIISISYATQQMNECSRLLQQQQQPI